MSNEIIYIVRRGFPLSVIKVRVGDLDQSKMDAVFLKKFNAEIKDPNYLVYIACDQNGNIDFGGQRKHYRMYAVDTHTTLIDSYAVRSVIKIHTDVNGTVNWKAVVPILQSLVK